MKPIFLVLSWVCLALGELCLLLFLLTFIFNRITVENLLTGNAMSTSERGALLRGAVLWFALAALFGLAGGAL